jgi:E3 ubiquitin-protein ligase RGLG
LTCAICSENNKNIALGCGHLLCEQCVRKVKSCPFCKRDITSLRRIYF